jgi:putative ABC transport system permease protein
VTAVVLLACCLALTLPLAVAAARRPTLARMALRNVGRRRTEAALIVGGALLGTAIITSAFVVGDVIDGAVADEVRTGYGPIDLAITSSDAVTFDAATERVTAAVGGMDGADVLSVSVATATLEAPARGTALPGLEVVELDLDEARSFGGDVAIAGFATVGELRPGEVVVPTGTADRLDLESGDQLRLHAGGSTSEVTVTGIVDRVGLAGYGGAIVPRGTFAGRTDAAAVRHQLLVSLEGGVDVPRDVTGDAATLLRSAVADLPDVRVDAPKIAVLDAAEQEGAGFTELFGTIGAFSVLAGILLLVNLFTMLAEERRSELGMLRALGFTRARLARGSAIEGVAYALPAAVLGAGLGLVIGWLVAVVAGGLLDVADEGARYALVVSPRSLVTGGALGLLVSLVTVWVASGRIARLNLVRALRDLPEPPRAPAGRRTLVLSGLGVAAGALLTLAGVLGEAGIPLLLGVPLAAYAGVPWLRRAFGARRARLLSAVTVLGWALLVVPVFDEIMRFDDAATFVLQGVVSTAGAVSLAGGLDRVWARVASRSGGGGSGLAARLGLAYPLARPARTSLLVGTFALVVFTITILSTVSTTFDRNSHVLAADVGIGADVLLDRDPSGAVDAEAIAAADQVGWVVEVTRGVATFGADHLLAPREWTLTGFDAPLLERGVPAALASRDPAYASDAAAYRAVLADPTLAVVPDGFLAGVGASVLRPGDAVTADDPVTGREHELTIVGVTKNDWLGTGVLVGQPLAASLTAGAELGVRSYVEVVADAEPGEVAASLNRAFLGSGADAAPIAPLVDEAMGQLRGLMAMLRGYLGFGLLIGTAGLGVVMVRAVRERRQSIAVLRALGASSRLVRSAMLVEAAVIVVQGSVIGVLLGLVTTRQLLSVLGDGLALTVPWLGLAAIVAVPLAASLAATAWPAARAAGIRPAVALRTAS